MNLDVVHYLDSLDLPAPHRQRIEAIHAGFVFLLGGREVERLYMATVREGAEIRPSSLWGFSGDNWLEARNFLIQEDFDISPYRGSINYVGVTSENITYPDGVTADSGLLVEVGTAKVEYSTLKAAGLGCSSLLELVTTLLLPNLKSSNIGGSAVVE